MKSDDDDDAKDADAALQLNASKLKDSDRVVIRIDDRTFNTTRGTLTQFKGTLIAKLFGAHHDMLHRDVDGAYFMNCNADTFAQVLDLLRYKGSVPKDFKMTHSLIQSLMDFELFETIFPDRDAASFNISDSSGIAGFGLSPMQEYRMHFRTYRSTAMVGTNYIAWNTPGLSSGESLNNDVQHWKVNPNDASEIEFTTAGYYRVTVRAATYCNCAVNMQLYINGSAVSNACTHSYSNNLYKSHNFNEILNISATQKMKIYLQKAFVEENSSFLSIEKIPDPLVPSIAIYKSTSSSSHYRQWN